MVKPIALTLGEPAGIGPDIAIAAWLRRESDSVPPFYLLGDRAFIAARAKLLGHEIPLVDVGQGDVSRIFSEALPIAATGHTATAQPGDPERG